MKAMKIGEGIIFVLLMILVTVPVAADNLGAQTQILAGVAYYVDGTTGNDSNPGTQALPWKTIQKAANTLQPGDTVNVSQGIYNERVNITTYHGSSGNLISFVAQGTVQCQGFTITRNYIRVKGFKVTAVVSGWTAAAYGIYVEGDNCIIEDNYAYYCPTTGIGSAAASAGCIFRNNKCQRNVQNGFEIDGFNHLIENNEIWGTITSYPPTNWVPAGDANGITYFRSGHIFRGNYIHDISFYDPESQAYSPHIDAFQTFGGDAGSNILFERNIIILPEGRADKNIRSCAWMLAGASNITIRNNIVIAHNGTETGGGGCDHLRIENNTFVGSLSNLANNWPIGISLENCPSSTVKNNIIYNQVGQAIYLLGTTYTGLDIGNNCTYNSDGSTPNASSGAKQATDLWGINPQFVNPASNDYHLQSSSPCINAGIAISDNTVDYEGNPRPLLSAWDIGAYEYNGPSAPLSASASANPTSGQAPLTVNFSGSATGGTAPYSYSWNFGDGGSSTTQNSSHTYSSAATYTATLTVTDSKSATNSKSLTITVSSTTSPLTATASANPTSGQAPLTVNFSGSATGGTAPYSYSWNFGDGGSSTSQNPSHTYSSAGTYTATLTVTDLSFANASATVNFTVEETTTTVNLSLAAQTGAPAPGEGGTTDPSPGNHSYSSGSTVSVKSIANTEYRFSKWTGDIVQASMFNSPTALTLNNDKSLSATFCTKCADVNGDLKITPGDAQLAFDIYLGKISSPTWCELENADVNCSGTKLTPKVTPADAQMIFHKYLKRGVASGDCSGNTRTAAVSTNTAGFINANLTIDNMAFTPDLDIVIPIIIECPSEVTAFGFDLTFPSNVLTFIRLESTELTKGYDQLDANVIPYHLINQEPANAEPAETLVLRVGGYKANPDQSPSSGVLVTLIFRGTGEFIDPSATSVIATYDDLQNASVINRMISRQDNSQIRENKRQGKNLK
jgi:PKD repeat protein